MTSYDTYRIRKVVKFIDDMSLIKYHIFTIDELKKRHKPELIELVMQMQGRENALVESLRQLLKQVKWHNPKKD